MIELIQPWIQSPLDIRGLCRSSRLTMAENAQNLSTRDPYDPFALAAALDRCAKWWWSASLTFKILGFAFGLLILPFSAETIPLVIAALTVLSEVTSYRSEAIRSRGQVIRRRLDFQDSLGWQISNAEFSDLLMRCPRSVRNRASTGQSTEPYFASNLPPGPRRALQNISESAWWSKHLSESMFKFCLWLVIVGVLISVSTLLIALQAIGQADARASVVRVVTALLMLLLSTDTIRLTLGYFGFAESAGRSELAATAQLDSKKAEDIDAIKIMNEYHVARAVGPIIPTWIWKYRRTELNQTWASYRAKSETG